MINNLAHYLVGKTKKKVSLKKDIIKQGVCYCGMVLNQLIFKVSWRTASGGRSVWLRSRTARCLAMVCISPTELPRAPITRMVPTMDRECYSSAKCHWDQCMYHDNFPYVNKIP
jgi:hypothetical protein